VQDSPLAVFCGARLVDFANGASSRLAKGTEGLSSRPRRDFSSLHACKER
jgi:hypothetical protein